MQKSYRLNSQHMPKGFPHHFDAHIYFKVQDIQKAEALRERIEANFSRPDFFIGDIIPEAIGPHADPMFEVNFSAEMFGEFVMWLMLNRAGHSILVHGLTGDGYVDHTDAALWLGEVVPLKLSAFKK